MKYQIEYEETIKRINSITIKVENEDEGQNVADELCNKENSFVHPDAIVEALDDMGIKIVEICLGAEDCEYEIL